jgi:hypothetical protein
VNLPQQGKSTDIADSVQIHWLPSVWGSNIESWAVVQMFIDDLPSWAFLGKTGKLMKPGEIDLTRWYLFTHIHFDILYHKDWVIEVAVSTDPELSVDITEKGTIAIDFSYSVNWRETEIPFGHRMDKFSKNAYLPQNMRVRHRFGIGQVRLFRPHSNIGEGECALCLFEEVARVRTNWYCCHSCLKI